MAKGKKMKPWKGWMFTRWDGSVSTYVYRTRFAVEKGEAPLRWFRVAVTELPAPLARGKGKKKGGKR